MLFFWPLNKANSSLLIVAFPLISFLYLSIDTCLFIQRDRSRCRKLQVKWEALWDWLLHMNNTNRLMLNEISHFYFTASFGTFHVEILCKLLRIYSTFVSFISLPSVIIYIYMYVVSVVVLRWILKKKKKLWFVLILEIGNTSHARTVLCCLLIAAFGVWTMERGERWFLHARPTRTL